MAEHKSLSELENTQEAKPAKPRRRGQLREAIAAKLRTHILRGVYPPGSQIPPIREIARDFHASISAVQRALALLIDENLLVAEHGRGVFVKGEKEVEEKSHKTILIPAKSGMRSRLKDQIYREVFRSQAEKLCGAQVEFSLYEDYKGHRNYEYHAHLLAEKGCTLCGCNEEMLPGLAFQGVAADITAMLDKLREVPPYLDAALEPLRYEGGLYGLPRSMRFPCMTVYRPALAKLAISDEAIGQMLESWESIAAMREAAAPEYQERFRVLVSDTTTLFFLWTLGIRQMGYAPYEGVSALYPNLLSEPGEDVLRKIQALAAGNLLSVRHWTDYKKEVRDLKKGDYPLRLWANVGIPASLMRVFGQKLEDFLLLPLPGFSGRALPRLLHTHAYVFNSRAPAETIQSAVKMLAHKETFSHLMGRLAAICEIEAYDLPPWVTESEESLFLAEIPQQWKRESRKWLENPQSVPVSPFWTSSVFYEDMEKIILQPDTDIPDMLQGHLQIGGA